MPTDIVMPQMGESIFEGTITKWLKKPGDKVQRDEPLFEISTDKVDAEIPAPAAGILAGHQGCRRRNRSGEYRSRHDCCRWRECAQPKPAPPAPAGSGKKGISSSQSRCPPPSRSQASAPQAAQVSDEEEDHARSSPLVRKIARENNVNLSQVSGTGLGGRITKQDITAFLERSQPTAGCAGRCCSSRARGQAGSPVLSRPGFHSRRSGAHDPDAQDHRAAHDRVAPHQRPRPLHVRSGPHPHRSICAIRTSLPSKSATARASPSCRSLLAPPSSRCSSFPS